MSIRDEFESWFCAEYGTPIGVLVNCRTEDSYTTRASTNIYYSWKAYQAAHQIQQQRIELLESAIHEFLKCDETYQPDEIEHLKACDNLRNLMEQSK